MLEPLGDHYRTLESMVCDQLRSWIVTGRLDPGTRLVENSIADEMGVSRGPVRNAIRQLVREGFVVLSPRKGAAVAAMSVGDALACYEVRIALESLAARLAATRRSGEDLERMEHVLTLGNRAVEANDWETLATLNNDFHAALAQASGNEELISLNAQYELRIAWIFSRAAKQRGMVAWQEHAEIVEAVRARASEVAEHLTGRHIERSRDEFIVQAGSDTPETPVFSPS